MVTRLKSKDLPQPWHSSKKTNAGKRGQKLGPSEASTAKDSHDQNAQGERKRRGRPSTKSVSNVIAPPKGMKKTRALPPSTVDVLQSLSETCVPDVEELRRKRQEDARACGRIVRTILPRRSGRSSSMVMANSSEEDRDVDGAEARATEARSSPVESSRSVPATEDISGPKDEAVTVMEEAEKESEPGFLQRPGKEVVVEDAEEDIAHRERKQECRRREGDYVNIDSADDSQERIEGRQRGREVRDRSLSTKNAREPYEGRRSENVDAIGEGRHSQQQWRDEAFPRSPRIERSRHRQKSPPRERSPRRERSRQRQKSPPRERSLRRGRSPGRERSPRRERSPGRERSPRRERDWNNCVLDSRSPQERDFGSPREWRGSRQHSHGPHLEEYDKSAFSRGLLEEYQNSGRCYSPDLGHRRRSESSSAERYYRHWRSHSGEHGRASRQQNRSTYLSMSPRRKSVDCRDAVGKDLTDFRSVKAEDLVETSAASDRRRRRHVQAVLDTETSRRKREGNKPFYLTLNAEGKPYGPGKPAWIAEINKLAKWLDPSCLHIRKQTFEDIQTFRDRLDDNFEYGGALNEDHLRSLMGKAITKKRAELINLIKSGGDNVEQPVHVDHKVWHRLQKMATSKQREERSEQGRYANSCRRVIGRTGRRGIDGVWEKLHSLLGRSPDPSEVEEKMQRDKGYGGRKRKNTAHAVKEEKSLAEVMLVDEGNHSGGSRRNSHPRRSYAVSAEAFDGRVEPIGEKRGRDSRSMIEDFDRAGRLNDGGYGSSSNSEANEMTKEEYIEKLKAEIKELQKKKANASTSKVDSIDRNTMK